MERRDEYRRVAWDCLQMAEASQDPQSRLTLVQIAQSFADLADQAEKNSRLGYQTPHRDYRHAHA
jgi:hypothetical protein